MSAVINETKALDEKMAQDRLEAGAAFAKGLAALKEKDRAAFSEFSRAAELGHVPAKANLAYCHKMGIGTKPDFFEAYKMLQELHAQYTKKKLEATAEKQKAEQLKSTSKILQAEQRLQSLQVKYAEANHQLARFYYIDLHSFKKEWSDPIRGIELFTEAANGNHAEALYYMGTFQKMGSYTVEKNETQAYISFTKSANLGCKQACFELGVFHESGVVGDETLDKMQAGIFYKQAADADHAEACLMTGICFAEGILGLEYAPFEGLRYLKKAADNRKADATIRPRALAAVSELVKKLEEKFSELNKKAQAAEEYEQKLREDIAVRDRRIVSRDIKIAELQAEVETLRRNAAQEPVASKVSEDSKKRPREEDDRRTVTVQYETARSSPAKRSRTDAMEGNTTQAAEKENKHKSEKNKTERSKMSVSKSRYPRLSLELH